VRGDLLLQARLLLRPRGVAGLVTALVGLIGATALYLPWYEIRAEVTMLGSRQSGVISSLAGWQAHPWLWLVAAVAVIAMLVGVAIAVDRPPPRGRDVLLGLAVALATVTGVSALIVPPPARFGAGDSLEQLQQIAARAPEDVEVQLVVTPAAGMWVALAAAALLLGVAFLHHDR
jgi:hypothetical protein